MLSDKLATENTTRTSFNALFPSCYYLHCQNNLLIVIHCSVYLRRVTYFCAFCCLFWYVNVFFPYWHHIGQ